MTPTCSRDFTDHQAGDFKVGDVVVARGKDEAMALGADDAFVWIENLACTVIGVTEHCDKDDGTAYQAVHVRSLDGERGMYWLSLDPGGIKAYIRHVD